MIFLIAKTIVLINEGENHMSNGIHIAFDVMTLRKGAVDLPIYQDRLIAALPNHELTFSLAREIPDAVYIPFAINSASGTDANLVMPIAREIWPTVIETAMKTTDTQPDVVSVLGDKIKVGHVTVFQNPNGTWSLEIVREIYKVDEDSITFGLGPIGHAQRTVLKNDKVVITKASANSVGG